MSLFLASADAKNANPTGQPIDCRCAISAMTSAGVLMAAIRSSSGWIGVTPAALTAASSIPLV